MNKLQRFHVLPKKQYNILSKRKRRSKRKYVTLRTQLILHLLDYLFLDLGIPFYFLNIYEIHEEILNSSYTLFLYIKNSEEHEYYITYVYNMESDESIYNVLEYIYYNGDWYLYEVL